MEKRNNVSSKEEFLEAVKAFPQCTSTQKIEELEQILHNFTRNPQSLDSLRDCLGSTPDLAPMLSILLNKSIQRHYSVLTLNKKNELIVSLLNFLDSFAYRSQISSQIAQSLSWIISFEDKFIENFPVILSFLEDHLQSTNLNELLTSLVLVQNIADYYPQAIKYPQVQLVCKVIDKLFKIVYNPQFQQHYISALGCLSTFIICIDENHSEALDELINHLLTKISQLTLEKNFFSSFSHELDAILGQSYQNYQTLLEEGKTLGNAAPKLLEFIINEKGLCFSWTLGTKAAMLELIASFAEIEPIWINPKSPFCRKFLTCLGDTLKSEAYQAQQVSQTVDFYKEEKLSNAAFICIEKLCTEYKIKEMRNFIKEFRDSLHGYPRLILELLAATAEPLQALYVKEFQTILEQYLLPGLNSSDLLISVSSLRTSCFFVEFLATNIEEHYPKLLECALNCLERRNLISMGPDLIDRQALLAENSLFLIEIIVENSEKEQLEGVSQSVLASVMSVYLCQEMEINTRRSALITLATIFSTTPQDVLFRSLEQIAKVLYRATTQEYTLGEALNALGSLSFYALKDKIDSTELFFSLFNASLQRSLQVVSQKPLLGFEIIEGALSSLYFAVQLLERKARMLVSKKLFEEVLELIRDTGKNSESEENSSIEENVNAAHLPQVYMIAAAVHFIGECLRHLPDLVQPPSNTEDCLLTILSSTEEVERKQAFIAIISWVVGQWIYYCTSHLPLLLRAMELIFEDEPATMVIHLESLEFLFQEMGKLPGGAEVVNAPGFYDALLRNIERVFLNFKGKEFPSNLFMALAELITVLAKQQNVDVPTLFFLSAFGGLQTAAFNREEKDEELLEELYGLGGELIENHPAFLSALATKHPQEFKTILDALVLLEEKGCVRNAAFFLGAVFYHMTLPLFGAVETLEALFKILQKLFEAAQAPEVRDNCVAAAVKLFLNKSYASIAAPFLGEDKIFMGIEFAVPLQGDKSESHYLVHALVLLSQRGYAPRIFVSKSILLFLIEVIVSPPHEAPENIGRTASELLRKNKDSPQLNAIIASLDEETKSRLSSIMTPFTS